MLKQGREAILFLFLFKFCCLFLNSQKVGFKSHKSGKQTNKPNALMQTNRSLLFSLLQRHSGQSFQRLGASSSFQTTFISKQPTRTEKLS